MGGTRRTAGGRHGSAANLLQAGLQLAQLVVHLLLPARELLFEGSLNTLHGWVIRVKDLQIFFAIFAFGVFLLARILLAHILLARILLAVLPRSPFPVGRHPFND